MHSGRLHRARALEPARRHLPRRIPLSADTRLLGVDVHVGVQDRRDPEPATGRSLRPAQAPDGGADIRVRRAAKDCSTQMVAGAPRNLTAFPRTPAAAVSA